MADLGNRANVNSAIDLLLDDLQPDEAIQPSDHNVLLKDILDTLANGLSTVLRTGNTTDGENLTITSSSIFQFANGSNGRLQSDTLTAFRNWTLPDTTGTIALLSDIPSSDNIYTADGTLTGNRAVDLDLKTLTFDVGTFSGVGVDKGLIIDGGDYQITNTNSTNSFLEVFNENGTVFNAMQRGGFLSYSDVNPLAFLLSRDSTKGLKLDTNNSRLSTNELIFNNSFSGNQGIYLRGSGTTNDLFF